MPRPQPLPWLPLPSGRVLLLSCLAGLLFAESFRFSFSAGLLLSLSAGLSLGFLAGLFLALCLLLSLLAGLGFSLGCRFLLGLDLLLTPCREFDAYKCHKHAEQGGNTCDEKYPAREACDLIGDEIKTCQHGDSAGDADEGDDQVEDPDGIIEDLHLYCALQDKDGKDQGHHSCVDLGGRRIIKKKNQTDEAHQDQQGAQSKSVPVYALVIACQEK